MDKACIPQKINEILIEEFEVDEEAIHPEASLKESLDLDRLDYVDLVVVIESSFGIKLVETDFDSVITFQDFYNAIEQKMAIKRG